MYFSTYRIAQIHLRILWAMTNWLHSLNILLMPPFEPCSKIKKTSFKICIRNLGMSLLPLFFWHHHVAPCIHLKGRLSYFCARTQPELPDLVHRAPVLCKHCRKAYRRIMVVTTILRFQLWRQTTSEKWHY